MRRSSARLRDLAVTAIVAWSLVLVAPAAPAAATIGCATQEWGTYSGSAATFGLNWSGNVGTWSVWITPAGTLAGLLNGPRRDSPGTRIGGGTGSGGSFTWNTYAFANGLYDIAFTYVRGSSSGGSYAYCALRIANLPSAPTPVNVSPTSNTQDVFDASWGASSASGGIAFYEYAVDCNSSRIVQTPLQGARLIGQAQTRGSWHRLCVRGVDRLGTPGPWAISGYFTYAFLTPNLGPLTGPDPAVVGAAYPMSALLADASGRPLPGKRVNFGAGWGQGAFATTDAQGRASVTLPGAVRPGGYLIQAVFYGDGTYAAAGIQRRIAVTPDTVAPTVPTGVAVTPPSSTVNSFRGSWSASTDAASGVAYYEWRIDNGPIQREITTSTASFLAPGVGLHTFEVRAVDRASNPSGFGSATFELRVVATTLTFTEAPASAPRCSSIDLSARLTSAGVPLAGRAVSLRIGGTGATAMTNATGIASASIRFEGAAGQYTVSASFSGDTVLPASQATSQIQVTGSGSGSCTPTGGGGPPPGGGGPPPGGGGQGQGSGAGQGGLSVDIPPR